MKPIFLLSFHQLILNAISINARELQNWDYLYFPRLQKSMLSENIIPTGINGMPMNLKILKSSTFKAVISEGWQKEIISA